MMSGKINLLNLRETINSFTEKYWSDERSIILNKLSELKDGEFKVDTELVQGNIFAKILTQRSSLLKLNNVTHGGFDLSSKRLKDLNIEYKLHHISIDSSNIASFISYIQNNNGNLLALFYVFR